MYYVLILENVLIFETRLIKERGFYKVYRKGVEMFVFGDRVERVLRGLTWE
jgi:hypothetical protein